jgi:hypothetical protein
MEDFNEEVENILKCDKIIPNDYRFSKSFYSENIYNLSTEQNFKDVVEKFRDEITMYDLFQYLPILLNIYNRYNGIESSIIFRHNDTYSTIISFLTDIYNSSADIYKFLDNIIESLLNFPEINEYDRERIKYLINEFIKPKLDKIIKNGNDNVSEGTNFQNKRDRNWYRYFFDKFIEMLLSSKQVNFIKRLNEIGTMIKKKYDVFSTINFNKLFNGDLSEFKKIYNIILDLDISQFSQVIDDLNISNEVIYDNDDDDGFIFKNYHINPYLPNFMIKFEDIYSDIIDYSKKLFHQINNPSYKHIDDDIKIAENNVKDAENNVKDAENKEKDDKILTKLKKDLNTLENDLIEKRTKRNVNEQKTQKEYLKIYDLIKKGLKQNYTLLIKVVNFKINLTFHTTVNLSKFFDHYCKKIPFILFENYKRPIAVRNPLLERQNNYNIFMDTGISYFFTYKFYEMNNFNYIMFEIMKKYKRADKNNELVNDYDIYNYYTDLNNNNNMNKFKTTIKNEINDLFNIEKQNKNILFLFSIIDNSKKEDIVFQCNNNPICDYYKSTSLDILNTHIDNRIINYLLSLLTALYAIETNPNNILEDIKLFSTIIDVKTGKSVLTGGNRRTMKKNINAKNKRKTKNVLIKKRKTKRFFLKKSNKYTKRKYY